MNKDQALTKLAALEAETKALRAIIEAPDTPAPPVRWRPEGTDEAYFIVLARGDVTGYRNSPLSDMEYDHGNCFKTQAQAKIAAKAVSATLKICAAAFAVDPYAGSYIPTVRRYSVYLLTDGTFGFSGYPDDMGKQIYVHTKEQAEQMAAILNAEGV